MSKTKLHDSQRAPCLLPLKGMIVLEVFKTNWLKVELPDGQFPLVSVGPVILADGAEGYFIRKEIVYESQASAPPPHIQ